jgi:hypothetical protein
MEASDDQSSYKHSKTKTPSKPIGIEQHSRQIREKQGNPEINMGQMQRTWFFMFL